MLVMLTLLHPLPTLYLYRAVMFHDTPEERYGDTPSPALWASPALRKAYEDAHSEYLKTEFDLHALNQEELDWLECLDKLEALYFSQHQMKLGNYHFQEIITNIFGWFEERSKMNRMPYRIQQIIEALQDEIVNGR